MCPVAPQMLVSFVFLVCHTTSAAVRRVDGAANAQEEPRFVLVTVELLMEPTAH